jgi:hypothetical protein
MNLKIGITAATAALLLALALMPPSASAQQQHEQKQHAPSAGKASGSTKASSPRVPLSSSVMIFGNQDLAGRCPQLLERAASHGSRSANIVLTQYWVDERFKGLPKTCNPDAWAEPSRVDYYCGYWEYADGCQKWSAAATANVTAGLKTCLTKAFELFDEVLISPHLDDGTRTGHW